LFFYQSAYSEFEFFGSEIFRKLNKLFNPGVWFLNMPCKQLGNNPWGLKILKLKEYDELQTRKMLILLNEKNLLTLPRSAVHFALL
jgi:hypothetical protein